MCICLIILSSPVNRPDHAHDTNRPSSRREPHIDRKTRYLIGHVVETTENRRRDGHVTAADADVGILRRTANFLNQFHFTPTRGDQRGDVIVQPRAGNIVHLQKLNSESLLFAAARVEIQLEAAEELS